MIGIQTMRIDLDLAHLNLQELVRTTLVFVNGVLAWVEAHPALDGFTRARHRSAVSIRRGCRGHVDLAGRATKSAARRTPSPSKDGM
jgi:hypothetical protein